MALQRRCCCFYACITSHWSNLVLEIGRSLNIESRVVIMILLVVVVAGYCLFSIYLADPLGSSGSQHLVKVWVHAPLVTSF